jgi:hypothetical protein
MGDTQPEALRVWLRLQRQVTPEQKLKRVSEMYEFMTAIQSAEVKRSHPEADEQEIFLRVAARRLGRELMKKVYGWQPDH